MRPVACAVALLAGFCIVVAQSPAPARAQSDGFFGGWFGFGPPQRQRRPAPPPYAGPDHYRDRFDGDRYGARDPFGGFGSRDPFDDRFVPREAPDPRMAPRRVTPRERAPDLDQGIGSGPAPVIASAPQGTVYCVRLCDGRYFPMPRSAAGPNGHAAAICNAFCPAAKTKIFSGADVENAVASDGTRYAKLDTAFKYRQQVVNNCSCDGKSPFGLARIDINKDPTLRPGDLVATRGGVMAFKGSNRLPYQTADFTPVKSLAQAGVDIRRKKR